MDSSTILKINPLQVRLQKIDRAVTAETLRSCQAEAIVQLYVLGKSFKGLHTPDNEYLNRKYPLDIAITHLCPLAKLSLVASCLGTARFGKLLSESDPSQNPQLLSYELTTFKERLHHLTGVKEDPNSEIMSLLNVLRMRLYAALQRCAAYSSNRDMTASKPGDEIEVGMEKVLPGKIMSCMRIFMWIEKSVEEPDKYPALLDQIPALIAFFQNFKEMLETLPHATEVTKKAQYVNDVLKIVQEAMQRPCELIPLLLAPIKVAPLGIGQNGDDSPAHFSSFLEDCSTAWEFQIQRYFSLLEENLKKKKIIKTTEPQLKAAMSTRDEILAETRQSYAKILDFWKNLQGQLSSTHEMKGKIESLKQAQQWHEQLQDSLGQDLVKLNGKLTRSLQKIAQVCQPDHVQEDPTSAGNDKEPCLACEYEYNIKRPGDLYRQLLRTSGTCIAQTAVNLPPFFEGKASLLDKDFQTLRVCTLLELLEHRARQHLSENSALRSYQRAFERLCMECHNYSYSVTQNSVKGQESLLARCDRARQDFANQVGDSKNIFADLLEDFICFKNLNHWPLLFITNPFAAQTEDPQLEARFRLQQLITLRQSLLELPASEIGESLQLLLQEPQGKEEEQLFNLAARQLEQARNALNNLQRELRKQAPPTQLLEEGLIFKHKFAQCLTQIDTHFNKAMIELTEYLALTPQPSPRILKLQEEIGKVKMDLQPFLSSCRPLFVYLMQQEWILTEQKAILAKQKAQVKRQTQPAVLLKPDLIETPPPALVTKPAAAPHPVPHTLSSLSEEVQKTGLQFASNCIGYTPGSNKQLDLLNTDLQSACAANLMACMRDLGPLCQAVSLAGDHPSIAEEVDFKLAVALEQALKLVAANLKMPVSEGNKTHQLFFKQGREFLREKHAPHIFAGLLKTKGLQLNEEQTNLLRQLARVIPVSSRYPASGGGIQEAEVQRLLGFQLMLEEKPQTAPLVKVNRDKTQKRLKIGLEALLAIFKFAMPDSSSQPIVERMSQEQLDKALAPLPSNQEDRDWRGRVNEACSSFQTTLDRLQGMRYERHAMAASVPPVHARESDLSQQMRKGTIEAALFDLSLNCSLKRDLLLMPEDPAHAPAIFACARRKQGAMLEQTLLMLLAHLPIPASGSPDHYLTTGAKRPKRYSHALSEFVDRLFAALPPKALSGVEDPEAFKKALREKADELENYNKRGYRYYRECSGKPREQLDRINLLSWLHQPSHFESLPHSLQNQVLTALRITDAPQGWQTGLETYINRLLKEEIKEDVLQTMGLLETLLNIYVDLQR